MYIWALEQLLIADTWEKKRRVLEEQQEFLVATRDASDILEILMDQAKFEPDSMSQRAYLLSYRGLLTNARLLGVDHAWSVFMMNMSAFQL
jgi:hypothetical protein